MKNRLFWISNKKLKKVKKFEKVKKYLNFRYNDIYKFIFN